MYKVKLNDGIVIEAELNGNNYIPEILDKNLFWNNLEKVIITDGDGSIEELYNQKVQFAKIGNIETFILSDKSNEEILQDGLLLALAELDMQREVDKTESQLAIAELATMMIGGE